MKAAEKLKYLRAEAKKHGLTFRAINTYYNGVRAYHLFDRKSGARVGSGDTLGGWFDAFRHGAVYFVDYREQAL